MHPPGTKQNVSRSVPFGTYAIHAMRTSCRQDAEAQERRGQGRMLDGREYELMDT